MKTQVKTFTKFINEQHERMHASHGPDAGNGIAIMDIRFGMGNSSTIITFGERSIELEDTDEDGTGSSWTEMFDAAAELGASPDMIWSNEDSEILFRHKIKKY